MTRTSILEWTPGCKPQWTCSSRWPSRWAEPIAPKEEITANNATKPNPDLERLSCLVGTWQVSGDATGEVTYEQLEGKFFLEQCFDLVHGGRAIKGIELIGYLHPFDGEPSEEIRTRVYSLTDGRTLDYVYKLEGETLMIWSGEKDSPMHCQGMFSDDGKTGNRAWHWPGGGYTANMTRRD